MSFLDTITSENRYNSEVPNPPKSPDCLIIQRCSPNRFKLYIVELRNTGRVDGFKVSEIVEKFTTCLEDFMANRFAHHFHDADCQYMDVKLLFISDPYGLADNPERQLKMRGHKFDALMAYRLPKFFGRHIYIEPKIPNPTIRPCA